MSAIRKVGKTSTRMMEMRGWEEVYYSEVGIQANTYACTDCGLVWDRKWYAETCEDRNHISTWEQKYGGRIENGRYIGYTAYVREAIYRIPLGQ